MITSLKVTYHFLKWLLKVNWIKTIYFNFKLLPFKTACCFPVIMYGSIKITSLKKGKLIINHPIRLGLIQFGKDVDGFPTSSLPIRLNIIGTLIFNGPVVISGGTNLTVWHGVMSFGKFCLIGSGVTIKCIEGVDIGDVSIIVGGCTIMDTNVHYVRDVKSGIVKKAFGKIKIGKYCWVNADTSINKNTVLPDYCIVARNSLLNRDYSTICLPASFLAGVPAKVKAENVACVFSEVEEQRLKFFFLNHPNDEDSTSYKDFPNEENEIYSLFNVY